jgi:hypothetical protein
MSTNVATAPTRKHATKTRLAASDHALAADNDSPWKGHISLPDWVFFDGMTLNLS